MLCSLVFAEPQNGAIFGEVVPRLQQALGRLTTSPPLRTEVEDVVRRETENWALRKYRRRPVVIPVVVDA